MEQDRQSKPSRSMVTFYHDIEQNIDSRADVDKCRQMVREFLKLEKKYNVPVTYNIVGSLYRDQPDLIEMIRESHQEVAFHSFNHPSDWQPKYYSNEIQLCRQFHPEIKGYRSPRSQWNRKTLKTLWDNEFLWNAEVDTMDEPYFIHKGLVRLPIAYDDWPLHIKQINARQWIEKFSQLLQTKRYVAFGCHDFVASFEPEQMLPAWEEILQTAIKNKSLLVNFSEAADMFRRAALAKYYSDFAQNWNRDTRELYRTKRFQELIRTEAEKHDQPVVADLGSGGAVLSGPLKDLAKNIYCIDNAPGMVDQAQVQDGIEGRLGEVTESNLPDKCCDLVICARVIEYLFWPERLADEIKRISKNGATYFITFPARGNKPPLNEGSPPDRIRHYFTLGQIQKWADLIGSGKLIGIQYQREEPQNIDQEHQYRCLEESPPAGKRPTNWVFTGTVQQPSIPKSYRQNFPPTAFDFQLPKLHRDTQKPILRRILRAPISIGRKLSAKLKG